jgi:RNA recognition motif-containing protein
VKPLGVPDVQFRKRKRKKFIYYFEFLKFQRVVQHQVEVRIKKVTYLQNLRLLKSMSLLFVGNLSILLEESELKSLFLPYGNVEEVTIKRDPSTNNSLHYGFVTMSSAPEAEVVLKALNGIQILGRPLVINWAKYQKNSISPYIPSSADCYSSASLRTDGSDGSITSVSSETECYYPSEQFKSSDAMINSVFFRFYSFQVMGVFLFEYKLL